MELLKDKAEGRAPPPFFFLKNGASERAVGRAPICDSIGRVGGSGLDGVLRRHGTEFKTKAHSGLHVRRGIPAIMPSALSQPYAIT